MAKFERAYVILGNDGSQSTLQPWAGGAVVSAPILVSGGQRFESSPVHFVSLLSGNGTPSVEHAAGEREASKPLLCPPKIPVAFPMPPGGGGEKQKLLLINK